MKLDFSTSLIFNLKHQRQISKHFKSNLVRQKARLSVKLYKTPLNVVDMSFD